MDHGRCFRLPHWIRGGGESLPALADHGRAVSDLEDPAAGTTADEQTVYPAGPDRDVARTVFVQNLTVYCALVEQGEREFPNVDQTAQILAHAKWLGSDYFTFAKSALDLTARVLVIRQAQLN